jgi:spore coat polysaccharide biosynthesis protein SpsF
MEINHNIAIILQARMGSTRRPYKIAALYDNKPLLYRQIKRLQLNNKVSTIIVATTMEDIDDTTEYIALSAGAKVFRGSSNDVMRRYIEAAKENNITHIIRVCGDDPLVDPECIETLATKILNTDSEIITASHNNGWMLGTSAEAFSLEALEKAYAVSDIEEKEHVVIHFYRNSDTYSVEKLEPKIIYQDTSLTVDYQEDVDNVFAIYDYFQTNDFSHKELLENLKNKNIKLPHQRFDKYSI